MRNANCFVVLFLNNLKTLVCVLESHIWHIINTYAFFFSMNFLVYKGTYFILTHACHLEFQWRVHPKRSNIVIHTGCRRRERNFGLHKGHKEADVNEVFVCSTPKLMSTEQRNSCSSYQFWGFLPLYCRFREWEYVGYFDLASFEAFIWCFTHN